MPAILLWVLSPIGRAAGIAVLVLSLVGGIYAKGRYDDHVAYTKQLTKEAVHAVTKADDARAAADKKFIANPPVADPKPRHRTLRHPFSVRHDPDGFARD